MSSAYAGSFNPAISAQFAELDQGGRVMAEYVWIDGTGQTMRSKGKVLDQKPASVADLPVWNYDGSSTGQAPGHDSEVLIKPARMYRDPFRKGDNVLVICETYQPIGEGKMKPLSHLPENFGISGNNNRAKALEVFENPTVKAQDPWFGLEQEYTLYEPGPELRTPLGFPSFGFPEAQGKYYCGAGATAAYGRDVAEAHLAACLYAGIEVTGINGEVMPGQWEYQVRNAGIAIGDDLWMSRFIMYRVCEKFNVQVTFHPKPMKGDWNGAGCHTNFSTADMRNPKLDFTYTPADGPYKGKALKGGFAKVVEACEKLSKKHDFLIKLYGSDNDQRMTGKHETASYDKFSYGVANRGCSIRIPRQTEGDGYGYMEDRRPSSNMDPYVVSSNLTKVILLD